MIMSSDNEQKEVSGITLCLMGNSFYERRHDDRADIYFKSSVHLI